MNPTTQTHWTGGLRELKMLPLHARSKGTVLLETLNGVRRWLVQQDGECMVHHGRIWITRDGEGIDHVLSTGDRLQVRQGDRLTLEQWKPNQPAQWAFYSDKSRSRPIKRAVMTITARALLAMGQRCCQWAWQLNSGPSHPREPSYPKAQD